MKNVFLIGKMNLTFTYVDPVTQNAQQLFIHNIPPGRIYHKINMDTGLAFVNNDGNRYQLWTTNPIQSGWQPNVGGNVEPDINFQNPYYTANMGVNGVSVRQVWSDNHDIWYTERF
jgi:hypothetical protein